MNHKDSCVQYISFDRVAQKVASYGSGSLMAKLDLSDAYKHIIISETRRLGCSWTNQNTTLTEHYLDLTLPFGLRSSAKWFTEFAYALKLSMEYGGVSDVEHYLDDYITIGPPDSPVCGDNLGIMLSKCAFIGI